MAIGAYYGNREHIVIYTGTEEQPDNLTYFVKTKKFANICACYHHHAGANYFGYFPIGSFFTGLVRIKNAVQKIFEELSSMLHGRDRAANSELWNAFKNLFRAIVECLPFTFFALSTYDTIREQIHRASIDRQIAQESDCCGVAVDGEVVMTVAIDKVAQAGLKSLPTAEWKRHLDLWAYACSGFLKRAQVSPVKELSKETKNIKEIFSIFKQKIENTPLQYAG